MRQRQVEVTKQHNVSRDPRVSHLQRIRPHLLMNCPRRNKLLHVGHLHDPRHMMIHTILRRALPHRTLGHWAPPQLCQVQVKLCDMSMHVALDYHTAIHTRTRLGLPKSFLGVRPHHLQIMLKPHHVTKDRRWPLLAEYRQLAEGNRLRHMTHVHNRHVMEVLRTRTHILQTSLPCRIWLSAASGRRPTRPTTF